MAAAQVLDESVPLDHDRCSAIGLWSAHWFSSRFESAVVALHAVVRVLLGVVKRLGNQLIDDSKQWCIQIFGDLTRSPMGDQCAFEKPCGRRDVSPIRHVHVDDLAVLINRAVDLAPHTSDLDIGLVNEPPIAHTVTTWPRRVNKGRRETLNPLLLAPPPPNGVTGFGQQDRFGAVLSFVWAEETWTMDWDQLAKRWRVLLCVLDRCV